MLRHKPWTLTIGITFLLFLSLFLVPVPLKSAEELPSQLSDEAFWRIVSDFSEDGGYFRSDNFMSNEDTFQWVIPSLTERTKPGGVYLGVGPEQNFTYIAALQSKMAFIIDIRRQNMLEHLLYKALFELSPDRADFVSRLFSRKRPPGLDGNPTPRVLFQAYRSAEPDETLFQENLSAVVTDLSAHHGFRLTSDDKEKIAYVYRALFEGGPQLTYNAGFNGGQQSQATYMQLMTTTDQEGQNRSYLANDETFGFIQRLEKQNLIVPLVGDFAGQKAFRAVGLYLKEHDARVTALYVSNVEQYLFQQGDDWSHFYTNVATLPIDDSSTFIRSFSGGFALQVGGRALRWFSTLSSMADFMTAFNEGRIRSYYDLQQLSR